ncbi:major capsid protein [Pseudoduganella sp. R-34]|uniref:major capsid protein n=1 Tax=Pseudoduganella sp. R-34 TaxID=3404062 RepID=UPI003CEDC097
MKKQFKYLAALALASAAGVSQAAVDISAEVTTAKTDIGTAGALIIGVVVSIAVFSWIRRVIK